MVAETMLASLNTLGGDIRAEHKLAESSAKQALGHAARCGELLAEAKRQVNHGEWGGWVKSNCGFSSGTAARYTKIAKYLANLPNPNRARARDLSLRSLLSNAKTDARFRSCEATMGQTAKCFDALAEIRDERLFRSTHENFEGYCRDKWKIDGERFAVLRDWPGKLERADAGGDNDEERGEREAIQELERAEAEAWARGN